MECPYKSITSAERIPVFQHHCGARIVKFHNSLDNTQTWLRSKMKGLKNSPVRAWGHGLARVLLCENLLGRRREEIVCQETLSVNPVDWLTGLSFHES